VPIAALALVEPAAQTRRRGRRAVVVDVERASGSTTDVENEERQRVPFDQQAALEELERFGRDIERYREQRRAVGEQFESFIRSFETPRERPPIDITTPALPREGTPPLTAAAPPAATPSPARPGTSPVLDVPASERAALDAGRDWEGLAAPVPAVPRPPDSPAPTAEVSAPVLVRDGASDRHAGWVTPEPDAGAPTTTVTVEPLGAPAARARSTFLTPALFGGTLIVVLAGGFLAMTLWNRAPASAPPAATSPETPVAAPEPAPAAAPAAAAAAAQPTSESQLTTIRRVWMRVTVDGARVLEREVPEGTTVPLNAEKTIVIRTGDAGAVRLSIRGGAAAPLGAEGEVVTRSFTVPPRAAAGR